MRANPVIVRATDEHAIAMAPRLRIVDCREIRESDDPLEIIRTSLGGASHAWAWIVDGAPVCMWGATPRSILGGSAFVWFLCTDAIAHADRRTFLLGSRAAVALLLAIYPCLEGFVDARFEKSVRWITKMGFRMGAPFRADGGFPLRHFVRER